MQNNNVIQDQLVSDNQKTIYYVDGLCGSGKTHGMGLFIKDSKYQKKFMITTPSRKLADEIKKQLDDLGIDNVYKIYSEDDLQASVPSRIISTIEEINALGQGVIICTQQIFPTIGCIEKRNEWTLIVDEIPAVDRFSDPTLPHTNNILAQYITVTNKYEGKTMRKIKLTDKTMDTNDDDILKVIRPIYNDVKSGHFKCYTVTENWNKLVQRNEISDDEDYKTLYGNERNKLYFLRLLQPSIVGGFQQVIMMGANFEQSMLYKYWSDYCGVKFQSFTPIVIKLRYIKYINGDRLTIRYLQEANWSKTASKKSTNGESYLEKHTKTVREFMGDNDFLYMTNNSDKTEFEKGIKAPVICHGMNQYQHIDNIYFSPALNNQPKHNAMLVDLGINIDFIKDAMAHEVAYQAIMRTSLRNPNSNALVNAVVIDKSTAEFIAGLFPNCHIAEIDGVIKKVIGKTNKEIKNKSRLQEIVEMHQLNDLVRQCQNTDLPPKKLDFTDLSVSFSFMNDIYYKSVATLNKDNEANPMAFVKLMKELFTNQIITQKDESFLFNCVSYKSEKSRKLDNVAYASMVIVDIDNGDLSHEEFIKIFTQNDNYKHSFFICNSFSRSEENPNNYRAVFFLKQVVNDENYRAVQAYICDILAKHGYITCWSKDREKHLEKNPNAKFSGVDKSKNHTASFFYTPCRVSGREDSAFFERYNLKDKAQLKRNAIDVEKVLQNQPEESFKTGLIYELDSKPRKYIINGNVVVSGGSIDKDAIKQHIRTGGFDFRHNQYGAMARAMNDAGFTEEEFIELTPFMSTGKNTKYARRMWNDFKDKTKITAGTMFYHLGFKRVA